MNYVNTQSTTLKEAALEYAANGFSILPLVPGQKKPACSHGYKDATTDANQIETWWSKNPNYNIGLLLGDGIVVIDLDVNHDDSSVNGIETLDQYIQEHGAFPPTTTCRTARGGLHKYYRVNTEVPTQLSAYPGIDICSNEHYAIMPPSVTEDGTYQWEGQSIIDGIAEADENVMKFVAPHRKKHTRSSSTPKSFKNPDEYPEIINEGGRHSFLLSMLGKMQYKGVSDEEIRVKINELNQQRCDPPMDEDELEREIFEALDRYPKGKTSKDNGEPIDINKLPDKWKITELLKKLDVFTNPRYSSLNDIALSRIFADCLKDFIRYNATARQWMYYNGIKWSLDVDRMSVEWLAKEFYDAMYIYTAEIDDEAEKDNVRKKISKLNSRTFRTQMVEDAKSDYSVETTDFDRNPDLINFQNCVYNLSTGSSMEHSSDLMLSKVANVAYRSDAESTDFIRFLDDIMLGDQDKINYLQTILGYALNGTSEREEAYIFYGSTTRNGKSTLLDTIRYLFGDYGRNIQPETLARKQKDSRSASGDVARLNGCRLVQMPEPPKNMKFDVALLKQLTGNDVLTARLLYQNDFEFKPIFKLFINTNYLPVVVDDTLFRSGRIKVITFDRHFEPDEQDPTLKNRLLDEENLSGILNWLLEGNRRGREDRSAFNPPETVISATEAYKQSSDKVQCFINERLDEDEDNVILAGTLYSEYMEWCKDNGYAVDKKSVFFEELRKKDMLKDHGTHEGKTARNVVKGYRIISIMSEPF